MKNVRKGESGQPFGLEALFFILPGHDAMQGFRIFYDVPENVDGMEDQIRRRNERKKEKEVFVPPCGGNRCVKSLQIDSEIQGLPAQASHLNCIYY